MLKFEKKVRRQKVNDRLCSFTILGYFALKNEELMTLGAQYWDSPGIEYKVCCPMVSDVVFFHKEIPPII